MKAKDLLIDIYDPEFFVAFEFIDKDPVKPRRCTSGLQVRDHATERQPVSVQPAARQESARVHGKPGYGPALRQQDRGQVPVTRERLLTGALVVVGLAVAAIAASSDLSWAQGTGPFGAPRPLPTAPDDGIIGWILTKQAEFYRQFSGLIRAAKTDGVAAWTLFGVAFLYGIFSRRRAGPRQGGDLVLHDRERRDLAARHCPVVRVGDDSIDRRACCLSGIAAGLIGVTSRAMGETVRWIEIASYGLIAILGLQLTWTKGRGFLAALRGTAAQDHDHHAHDHGHHHAHDLCVHARTTGMDTAM